MNATSKKEQATLNTLTRDQNGYGALPGFEDFALPEEELAPGAVVNGHEVSVLRLVDDVNAKEIAARWLGGDNNLGEWKPTAPAGDDWNLAAVLEHEEGPYAVFAKPGVHGVLTGKAYAQEYLLGAMIKAATKHMKTLSKPWIDMKEAEQKRVLATVQQDCRNAEKLRRRDAACVRIRELLAAQQMSVGAIAAALGLNMGTVYGYLCFLAELGEVRRAGVPGARRPLWELGVEDVSKLEAHVMRPQGAVIVPAVQVGMWRDPLDVALFGQARTAA